MHECNTTTNKNSQIDQVDFYLCGNFSTKPNTIEFIEIKAKKKN